MSQTTPTKTKKYLIETSAVRPALRSPSPVYNAYFDDQVRDGALYASAFVRMEFIRLWVCYAIKAAVLVNQCTTVAHALYLLEQEFGRGPKNLAATIQAILNRNAELTNKKAACEEIGRTAVHLLRYQFDRILKSRSANRCCCQLGERRLKVDYNCLLNDLYDFYVNFDTPVEDCKINAFFRKNAELKKLVDNETIRGNIKAVNELAGLQEKKAWITCKECRKIGDAVIALDQDGEFELVHTDKAFGVMCPTLNKKHKHLQAPISVDKVEIRRPDPA